MTVSAADIHWGDGNGSNMTVSAADIHWGDGNGSNMTVSAADIHWGDGNGSNKVLSLSLGLGPCYEHCSLCSSWSFGAGYVPFMVNSQLE